MNWIWAAGGKRSRHKRFCDPRVARSFRIVRKVFAFTHANLRYAVGDQLQRTDIMDLLGKDGGDLLGMAQELMQKNGGLAGLKGKLDGAGLGDAIGSWIGTGENQEVDANQLAGALGQDQIQGLADKAGLDVGKLLPMLSTLLPQIIDKITPDGDEAGADAKLADKDSLQGTLDGLLKGGLGNLLG